MNDLNPPPERDLDRRHRDAIRSVLADAGGDRRRRVAAPLLAAAAVGAVVATGIVLTRDGGSEPAGGPGTPSTLGTASATGTPSAAGTPQPTSARSAGQTVLPSFRQSLPQPPERTESTVPGRPLKAPIAICRELLTEHATNTGEPVPGPDARIVASTSGRWGTTLILADDNRWAGCDTAGYTHNHASLREPGRIDKPAVGDDDAFAVDEYAQSQNWSDSEPWYQYFWAAGLVPDGVAKIMYTFPGGRTAFAKITGDYWVMQHAGGRIALGQDVDQPNIKVTLTRADGSVIRTFPLAWGEQTCEATNHGC
jgi:hypothetical protein